MMGIGKKILDILGGSAVEKVASIVKEYFPPDMPPEKRAELEFKLKQLAHKQTLEAQKAANEAERLLTERISQLEGTAQDLRSIPIVGPIVIFLRGLQRLVWGYACLYIDFMWFNGTWKLGNQQESAMWIINFLVLGFLFGERAIQNIMPLFIELQKRKGTP